MMKKLTRTEAARFLQERDHFAILSHRRPDGDTIGSSAALCLGLRMLGKTAHVIENPEVSPRFQWLHAGLTKKSVEAGDTIVSTDVAAPNMLPRDLEHLVGSIALRIDHHGTASSFTEFEIVDPESASCAELVYDILMEMGAEMDKNLAEAVYVGASTDTGCFRFANTTAHTFHTAAACAEAGAGIYELNQALFETNTLGRLRIQAWIVEHMKLLREGELALCAIPRSVEQELGVTEDDMDNISSFPRSIAGVQVAATLRETADGETKMSFRAVPGKDAAAIAVKFGGGGHKGAAGASLHLPLKEAAEQVEKVMLEEAP